MNDTTRKIETADTTKSATCPRCGEETMQPEEVRNALSRRDNETYVCNICGRHEAMINAQFGRDADVWPGYPGVMPVV